MRLVLMVMLPLPINTLVVCDVCVCQHQEPFCVPPSTHTQVLCDVLASSRTSRIVSRLVLGQGVNGRSGRPPPLLAGAAAAAYPGEKYPGLTLVYGVPRQGQLHRALYTRCMRSTVFVCMREGQSG